MSGKDDEWFERDDHPLLNNVVLDKVFKHLRGNELKECRLVCKTWNVCTIPLTRKAFQVTIYKNVPEFTGNNMHKRSIGKFMEVFRFNKFGIPFARFQLGAFCTTDGVGQEFLQLFGHVIMDVGFVKGDFMVEDISAILISTPKLETFEVPMNLYSRLRNTVKLFPQDSNPKLSSLKILTVAFFSQNICCPTFLVELITAAENISCLTLCDSYVIFENYISTSFEVLSLIEKLGRESMIQELQILYNKKRDGGSEIFELLRKMKEKPNGLKLKRLDYSTYRSRQGNDTPQLSSLYKDTLREVTIQDVSYISFMDFPRISRETRLEMKPFQDLFSSFVNLRDIS